MVFTVKNRVNRFGEGKKGQTQLPLHNYYRSADTFLKSARKKEGWLKKSSTFLVGGEKAGYWEVWRRDKYGGSHKISPTFRTKIEAKRWKKLYSKFRKQPDDNRKPSFLSVI